MFKRLLFISLLVTMLCGPLAQAETAPLPPRHVISIILIGPGEDLFSRFGHIGILVEDREAHDRHKALVYNYGTFSFDDPDLWLKYAMGYLNYWVSTNRLSWTFRAYASADRQLERFTLDIPEKEAAEIAAFLQENIKPENRYFFYRHYLDNCCTRIRDIINRFLQGKLQETASQKAGHTYRYWTNYSLRNMPIMGFVIDYVLGREIDRPISRWEEYFLPQNFAEDLEQIKLADGRPLVKEHIVLHQRKAPEPSASWPLWEGILLWTLLALFILGAIVPVFFAARKWAKKLFSLGLFLWGLLPGLGGLILLFFLFTQHLDTHWNENILLTPLTHLLLVWGAWQCLRQKENLPNCMKTIRYYLLGASGVILIMLLLKLGPLFQMNYGLLFSMLAGNLWLALVAIPRLQPQKGVNHVQ